jgi:hypothetical protein
VNSAYFKNRIRAGLEPSELNAFCLELFHFQAENNPVYHQFIKAIGKSTTATDLSEIPFLPISFFKTHKIISGNSQPAEVFFSSGTTGTEQSQHFVADPSFYLENTVRNFGYFYGHPSEYTFLALLPGYVDRPGSSLIRMVDHFITLGSGGFYPDDHAGLLNAIEIASTGNKKIILWGVTYALLDFAEYIQKNDFNLPQVIVMETGGMKGKRKEMIREEVHKTLMASFKTGFIHSEYGMTELFSQAYSPGEGLFHSPPVMKILTRNVTDPMDILPAGRSGAINIIDAANVDSISFIATDDLGKIHDDESFEILGRTDNSDVRGCNLLVG